MIVATLPDGTQMSHGNVNSESVQVDRGNVTPASGSNDVWIPEPPTAHPALAKAHTPHIRSLMATYGTRGSAARGQPGRRIRGHGDCTCANHGGGRLCETSDSNNSSDACEENVFMIQAQEATESPTSIPDLQRNVPVQSGLQRNVPIQSSHSERIQIDPSEESQVNNVNASND